MNEILKKIDMSQFGIEETKAAEIRKDFDAVLKIAEELEVDYNEVVAADEITPELAKQAKVIRLKYVKVRTGIAAVHKERKAFYLSGGRAVDGLKNAYTHAVEGNEAKLKEVETHFEQIEADRINKLQADRAAELEKFDGEQNAMFVNLGVMPDYLWIEYRDGVEFAFNQRKEAERKAEEDRIAKEKEEQEERERVAKENERLKAEAAEREKREIAEREAREIAERQRAELEEKERKDREEAEVKRLKAEDDARAKIKAERENERKEAEVKIAAEREARERIERKHKNKEEKERKDREEAENREKDQKHRKSINNAALKSIVLAISGDHSDSEKIAMAAEKIARAIVTAIANGEIANVSIKY